MNRKRTIFAGFFIIAVLSILFLPAQIDAVFKEEDAVKIKPEHMEDSTLIIGTHLLYLGSVTEKIYEESIKSAEESGQKDMYYKSELGDGKWYCLSDASSLKDITGKGKAVPDSEIEKLFFMYHTKKDKITYDLRSNKAANIYDINSPYDLENLRELAPLSNHQQINDNGGSTFKLKVKDGETKKCDKELKALQKLYVKMSESDASAEQLAMIDMAMQKVDAGRRYHIYGKLQKHLNNLADKDKGDDADYREALSDSIRMIEDSLIESEGEMRGMAGTVMSKTEEELVGELIEAVKPVQKASSEGEDDEEDDDEEDDDEEDDEDKVDEKVWKEVLRECFDILKRMTVLDHIVNGQIVSEKEERDFIQEILIPKAEMAYRQNPTEITKNELQYYREELAKRGQETDETDETLRKLYDEKEVIKKARLDALDREDLKAAKRQEALLEEKNTQIQSEEDKKSRDAATLERQKTELERDLQRAASEGKTTTEIENKITELESRIAGTLESVGEGSAASDIKKMEAEAYEAVEEGTGGIGRLTEAAAGIGALCVTNPRLAGSTLEALYQKLAAKEYMEDTKAYDPVLEQIEAVLTENKTVLDGELSREEVVSIMDAQKVKGTKEESAAILLGLSMFCEEVDENEISMLLKGKAETEVMNGKERSYVYEAVSGESGKKYVPADVAASYASLRYIWNDSKKQATLASRGKYYRFTAFSDIAVKDKAKERLGVPAKFKSTVYIPEDYVKQELGCEVYSIPNTGYCILIDDSMKDKASEVCNALLQKGE